MSSRKSWIDLWSIMADHDKGDFDSLKNTPGMEFWRLFEIFKRKADKEREKR